MGERAIVSFPNFGYWRCRLDAARPPAASPGDPIWPWHGTWPPGGRRSPSATLPIFAARHGIAITRQAYLAHGRQTCIIKFTNLFSTTAVFVLDRVVG